MEVGKPCELWAMQRKLISTTYIFPYISSQMFVKVCDESQVTKNFQVGRKTDGLELVPFCSGRLHCNENFAHALTSRGLCSIYGGLPLASLVRLSPEHKRILSSHFDIDLSSDDKNSKMFSDLKEFTIAMDIHNSDILKAHRQGRINMAVTDPGNYLNQVRARLTPLPFVL